jgi:hypothetical protein
VRGARTALVLVVALQLVAETALTPYWPSLLRTLFGAEELSATGTYLTVCRVAGLAALPLWGLAARRWPAPRLLVAGLLGSAVFDLGLALAPSLPLFTALSAAVVATGSVLVLAYPALVEVVDRAAGSRVHAVVAYAAVFHGTAVVATLVGAGIVALPQPRIGLAAFAVVDLALAVLVLRMVPAVPQAAATGPERPRLPVVPLVAVAVLAVLVDLGIAVARPFFTELVLRGGGDLAVAAGLFLLPAAAALAVLPLAVTAVRRVGPALLPLSALAAAAGLAVQAAGATSVPVLAAGRVLFGVALGLAVVALDLRVFAAVGTAGPGFAAVETARSGALLVAPVLATAAASAALAMPLVVAATLLTVTAAVAAVPVPAGAPPVPAPPRPVTLEEPTRAAR